MHKMIACILLIGLLSLLCLNGYATEYSDPLDSRNVPAKLLYLTHPGEGDILFRYYNIGILFEFAERDSIEAILEKAIEDSIPLYALETSDGQRVVFETYDNGASYETADKNHQGSWANPSFQEHRTGEAIRTVSPDIIIESMYYLKGENSMMGTAIYYKTNLGDYVFFKHSSIGERLFSAEAFFEYNRALYAEIVRANADGSQVGVFNYSDWDLSAYDYRSEDFDPHAPFPKNAEPEQTPSSYLWVGIASGAVVLIAIAAFFALKIKRKAAILPEEA